MYDKIEDYFEGNLNDSERREFEHAVKKDKTLAEEVEQYKLAYLALNLDRQVDLTKEVQTLVSKSKSRRIKIYRIAASLVFILSLAFLYLGLNSNYSNKAIASQYFDIYPASTLMGNAGRKEIFNLGLERYQNKNYKEAISLLEQIPDTSSDYAMANFYLGNAYFATPQFDASIEAFKNFQTHYVQKDSKYNASELYIALAYLQKGEVVQAKSLLENIKATSEKTYSEKADRALEKIDSFWRNLLFMKQK